jgi:hypothetical protein
MAIVDRHDPKLLNTILQFFSAKRPGDFVFPDQMRKALPGIDVHKIEQMLKDIASFDLNLTIQWGFFMPLKQRKVMLTIKGTNKSLMSITKTLNLNYHSTYYRITHGYPLEIAIEEKRHPGFRPMELRVNSLMKPRIKVVK